MYYVVRLNFSNNQQINGKLTMAFEDAKRATKELMTLFITFSSF